MARLWRDVPLRARAARAPPARLGPASTSAVIVSITTEDGERRRRQRGSTHPLVWGAPGETDRR